MAESVSFAFRPARADDTVAPFADGNRPHSQSRWSFVSRSIRRGVVWRRLFPRARFLEGSAHRDLSAPAQQWHSDRAPENAHLMGAARSYRRQKSHGGRALRTI